MDVYYAPPVAAAVAAAGPVAAAAADPAHSVAAAAAAPPVVVVLRSHGASLPNNAPISQSVMSLFSDHGQITLLRKSRVGLRAIQNERNWQQLFQIIQDAKTSGRTSYEDLLRIITQTVISVPVLGDYPGESEPFRITPISHGMEHLYTFYDSDPHPQNSRALGIYDTDELNKLITPGQAPSGTQCGLVLKKGNSASPLGDLMPVTFDNSLLNVHPELRESPFRQYTLSEIAIDLHYRYPGRKIILVEVACRGGEQFSGLSPEDVSYTELVTEMGEMSLLSPASSHKTGTKRKSKKGGRTVKNLANKKNKKTRRQNKK